MLDKLEFILALAREQHFGRAAEACGVTQPTLSAGVKQLEEQMGVLLVNAARASRASRPKASACSTGRAASSATARAMREEINALRHGLTGQLRIAAIPTALAMVAALTTPYRERHPNVRFTIYSRTSIEILDLLENLEIDAGITYLGNEPLGRVNAVPLYHERYRLLTSADAPLGNRDTVTWAEVAQVPLCLLTPDMQNRRIIDRLLQERGRRSAADAGIEFDDPAVLARAHRPLGERDAGEARRDAGPHRHHPRDPDHRARGGADHRPGGAGARADDAAHRRAGGGGEAGRAHDGSGVTPNVAVPIGCTRAIFANIQCGWQAGGQT